MSKPVEVNLNAYAQLSDRRTERVRGAFSFANGFGIEQVASGRAWRVQPRGFTTKNVLVTPLLGNTAAGDYAGDASANHKELSAMRITSTKRSLCIDDHEVAIVSVNSAQRQRRIRNSGRSGSAMAEVSYELSDWGAAAIEGGKLDADDVSAAAYACWILDGEATRNPSRFRY